MDPRQKQIVIGSVSGIIGLAVLISIIVVIVLYKKGKFTTSINKLKVKLYKNYIHKIRLERPGTLSLVKGELFDSAGTKINTKSTYTSTQVSIYTGTKPAADIFLDPPGAWATWGSSADWAEITLGTPLTIAKISLTGQGGFDSRQDQLKCIAYNVDDTIAFTGVNTVIAATISYKLL